MCAPDEIGQSEPASQEEKKSGPPLINVSSKNTEVYVSIYRYCHLLQWFW